jgi:arginine/lysine/ornithine decarboxylase
MLLERCGSAIGGLGFHIHENRTERLSVQGPQAIPLGTRRQRSLSTGRGPVLSRGTCHVSKTQEEACTGKPDCVPWSGEDATGNGVVRGEAKADEAPLVSALRECAEMDAAPFHFPGHRRGAGAPPMMAALVGKGAFAADLPELPELDNLHAAEGVILEAQSKAARLFGAEHTWFLVNGSTCGIQAAVMATCAPGDYLILPRNVHMSAVSAMVLSGALPKYVTPVPDPAWGVAHGVRAAQVESAIREVQRTGGRVSAVLVVSPTYFGVCSHIGELARVCHSQGIPLIVDEAHGAHFRFHHKLPQTALEQGADVAVQSTHKVLSSLTQSAMLHTQGSRVHRERLAQCLQMLQSSSPSYLLLGSLDASRAHMEGNCVVDSETGALQSSDSNLDAALSLASTVRQSLQALPGLSVLDMASMSQEAAGIDPLRITVGLWKLGLTGFEADDILRLDHGVVAELPSLRSITFAISAGSSHRDAVRLIDAFAALSARYASELETETGSTVSSPSHAPEHDAMETHTVWENQVMALSPRDAFYSKSEKVLAQDAVGRVSAELLCPYPPGIPVVTPGEVITQEAVDCITAVLAGGGVVSGASDESFQFARVVVHDGSKL